MTSCEKSFGGHKVVKVVNLIRPGGIDRADIDAIRTVYIQAGEQLVGVFCYGDFLCQIVKGNEDFTRLGNRFAERTISLRRKVSKSKMH